MRRYTILLIFLVLLSACSHRSYHRIDHTIVKKEKRKAERSFALHPLYSEPVDVPPEEAYIVATEPPLPSIAVLPSQSEPSPSQSTQSNSNKSESSKPKIRSKAVAKKAAPKSVVSPKIDTMASKEGKVKKSKSIAKRSLVILDAGHGGKDTGARSTKNAYEEKVLTLQTVNLIKTYLTKMGYEVMLTRKQDTYISLEERAEMANALKAALFVSVHYNYSPNEDAEGIEVFYYKDEKNPYTKRLIESRRLGEAVLSGIVKHTGAIPRGVKRANFAVIRETKMPAVLIEGGFLSHCDERRKILEVPYRQFLAFGIASGIDKYLNANN